jgi:hypothetical protein
MRRARSHAIAGFAVLASVGFAALVASESRPDAFATTKPVPDWSSFPSGVLATQAVHPQSCKPSPPVQIELHSSGSGTWTVRLQADLPVTDAVLRLGASTPSGDMAPEIAWRGSLARGEAREVEVRWTPPAGAQSVWAELASDERGESRQRTRAGLVLAGGREAAALTAQREPEPESRTVVDPQSGQGVFEVRGAQGGGR